MISGGPQESIFNLKNVYNWFNFEQSCQLCLTPNQNAICKDCYNNLAFNVFACPHCAHPVMPGDLCKECVTQNFYFDDAIAPFIYEEDVKKLIQKIKYHSDFINIDQLLGPLKQRITIKPDAIMYVPSHPSRQHERGYNQAEIIASNISDDLHIPIFDYCKRKKPTDTLVNKSKKQRAKLLKGVFECHEKVPEHVAIVDDVLTTGATVNELSKLLRRKGAKRISVWVIGRAVKV